MTNLYSFAGIYERCWIRQTPSVQNTRSLWESKSKEYSYSERRKREYGEPLQHVKVLKALFVSCPHLLDQGSCQSQVPVHQPWSGPAQTTSVHFTLYITIYMAKAAAERLFLTRRNQKCGLKCLTKIKSNNIGIDTHASLQEQIFFARLIFADSSSFV